MSSEASHARSGDVQLAALCERAQVLASAMPGPLLLLRVQAGDASIEVRWQEAAAVPAGTALAVNGAGSGDGAAVGPGAQGTGAAVEEDVATLIAAPMVGTFYRAPSPGAEPFVRPGDLVEPGQTVGIVEAMKLMNPITAECVGQVADVLVEDGAPVEFGQPLMALAAAEEAS